MLYLLHLPRRRKRDPKAPEPARRGLRYAPLRPRRRLFQAPLVRSRNPTRVTRQLRTKPARPFVGRSFLSGISVLTSDSNSPIGRTTSLCKVLASFGPRCFQRHREGPVSHLVGTQRLEMSFLRTVPRHFPCAPSVVIEICSAPHSPYPIGAGSATILRSMPLNSRRVRCPSANGNQ